MAPRRLRSFCDGSDAALAAWARLWGVLPFLHGLSSSSTPRIPSGPRR